MKAAILFSLKVFLLNFIPYFSLMSLIHYLTEGTVRFSNTLFTALIFGVSLTVFHVYKHIREVKKLNPDGLNPEDFHVKQSATLALPLTKEEIIRRLHNSIPAKEWNIADEPNAIKLKTSYTWKSQGEKIRIEVKKLNEQLSEISIVSKPKNPLNFFDYGKNQENILYLRQVLSAA